MISLGKAVVAYCEPDVETRASVTVGPFAIFFTNINRAIRFPGQSQFAQVKIKDVTNGTGHGFPAFAPTYAAIQRHLVALTARPFHDMTNEDVAAHLWTAFLDWRDDEVERWGGCFSLTKLELAVRGVPDHMGHADGFTTYTVEAVSA